MIKKVETELLLDFNDVLIKPKVSDITLTRADVNINIPWASTEATPIVIANMMSTGTYKIAKIASKEKVLTFLSKEYTIEEHRKHLPSIDQRYIAISSGVREKDLIKTLSILEEFPDIPAVNVDIANVYANIQGMWETVSEIRNRFPNIIIIAGNIATPEPIADLVDAGANYIKVGVGSGAACKTRSEVGIGIPQLSAIMDCHHHARSYGVKIISDGGCVTAGDVSKAIAAGAELVMIAGMVSHCEECDNIIDINGDKFVSFYGLGSDKMYSIKKPDQAEYRPNEGRDLMIPVTGSIVEVIKQIKGALRSTCTYVGAPSINALYNKSVFVRVNNTINRSLERYGSK